jgi:hypothetical protein
MPAGQAHAACRAILFQQPCEEIARLKLRANDGKRREGPQDTGRLKRRKLRDPMNEARTRAEPINTTLQAGRHQGGGLRVPGAATPRRSVVLHVLCRRGRSPLRCFM